MHQRARRLKAHNALTHGAPEHAPLASRHAYRDHLLRSQRDSERQGVEAQTYDYIIVGAGSAGCVIAHRLVQAGHTVLALEAGPTDRIKFVEIPATFVRVIGTERSWVYETVPQPHANGRKMFVPQGRMPGGGSSLRQ